MARLVEVQVWDLLGRFKHRIEFPADDPFVIVYGPNGVGKTKLLELITSASNGNFVEVASMPFSRAEFRYDSRHRLELKRESIASGPADSVASEGPMRVVVRLSGEERPYTASFTEDRSEWNLRHLRDEDFLERQREYLLEHDSSFSISFGSDIDVPISDTDIMTYQRLRHERMREEDQSGPDRLAEAEIRRFIKQSPAHLVETQRLLATEPKAKSKRRGGDSLPAVVQLSRDLAQRIEQALAQNSTVSQRLDRSFPNRLLSTGDPSPSTATDEQLRKRYEVQTEIRNQLAAISVADAAEPIDLPTRTLFDWERRMLETYMDDADEKLATFKDLLDKVNLLTAIVNPRFLFKDLQVSRERGFTCKSDEGQPIPLTALSSGEQHELVLAYDLLFNVQKNSIVLIDEPEISLHVAWQQKFLEDLERIAHVVEARFIVATHSPQVIHTWRSKAQSLFGEIPA